MMKKLIFLGIVVFALVGVRSCYKGIGGDKEVESREIKIIKSLPIIYGAVLEENELRLIHSQIELSNLIGSQSSDFPPEMTGIDFDKQVLILGTRSYIKGITKLKHRFEKKDSEVYYYYLDVIYDKTPSVGLFSFGILLDKLPEEAKVKLVVNEINT